MAIVSSTFGLLGQDGVTPRRVQLVVTDSLQALTTAGYLTEEGLLPNVLYPTDIIDCIYAYSTVSQTGTYGQFQGIVNTTNGLITLSGVGLFADAVSSATPGTVRALVGKMVQTATVETSGNLVGVRGEVDMVGASGGFYYGAQGKIIPTGTLSGSSWTAGVFGQLDISHATINAGQTAPIWADYGATSGTITDATGMRMFSGTNTTAATLFAMDYRYGKATNLLELDGSSSTYISTGGATASGTIKKIAISIDGVQYYLQAATVYS